MPGRFVSDALSGVEGEAVLVDAEVGFGPVVVGESVEAGPVEDVVAAVVDEVD